MNRVLFVLGVWCCTQALLPSLQAAPANDNFANRLRLLGAVVTTTGNSDAATVEASEPLHWAAGNGGKSVWWTWTAPNTAPVTVSTGGSAFDTLLAVYTGSSLAGLTLVANNDNFGGGNISTVSFNATAGTVYQIAVDGAGNPAASGAITLTVSNPYPTTTALVPFGAVWSYKDDGSDQGTAWITPGFNDSLWASGPAQLGYGDSPPDEVTMVSFGPDGANKYITTYFRRPFSVPDASPYIGLNLRLIRDDGGIVYLNGQEIFRTAMPASGVNFQTLATGNGENTLDQTRLDSFLPLLLNGANVIAAEIHQVQPTSSDISFDLELSGIRPFTNRAPNVVILTPTNNPSFVSPATIPITVEAWDNDTTVTNVSFFSGTTLLGRDVTHPYAFTWAGVNPGSYQLRAVATDDGGLSTTSAVANVTVTGVANTPPTVSITSPANNATFDAPTNLAVTVNAADPGGSVTKVEYFRSGTKLGESAVSPFTFIWTNALVGTFQLTAMATDNGLLTGTSGPVTVNFTGTGPATLIATGSVWKYFDTVTGELPGWNTLGFDDSGWASGPAELGYGDAGEGRPEATVVGFGPDGNNKYISTYFRRTFDVANPGVFSYLTFRLMRDDGAVVYLNGVEVFRDNMPATPIAFNTLALTAIGGAAEAAFLTTNSLISLAPGPNVVAVEIHQQSGTSSDISFDLELIGNTGAVVNNPPTVALVSPSNNSTSTAPATVTLSATASDSDGSVVKVEFYMNGARLGEDTTAPYAFTVGNLAVGAYAFYAIATDSFGGTNVSGTNTLYVTPSTPPAVAGQNPAPGSVGALTQVTVNFTEPVDGVDASDLLINGLPASAVSGANAVYTFSFAQPLEGLVSVAFAREAGIVDRETPPRPLDPNGPGASWQYTLTDTTAPAAVRIQPVPSATVRSLTEVEVTFGEAVAGVEAADLRINGAGASSVSGSGAGPYRFQFTQPLGTNVQVNWTNTHGIHDLAAAQNPFAGGAWTYHLNTNVVETNVVINEIMYHPASQLATEEFIELHNRGNNPVNLHGWRLTRGVSFTFTNRVLPARGFLVVAANLAAFNARYPGVAGVVGNWSGSLANSGEDIELENAQGQRVDLVAYADEGDWSDRQRVSFGGSFFGWVWADDHDGLGKSLELRNPAMPNEYGRNWSASLANNGTPGTTNSVFTTNIPPLIVQGQHAPLVPRPTDPIAISARIIDEQTNGIVATLFYRIANAAPLPAFSATPMFDDGNHGDGGLNDGVYGATLPAQPNGRILEFYVRAVDSGNRTNTWPAPGRDVDGVTALQTANGLLMVDEDPRTTSPNPTYWLIMTEPDRAMLAAIDGSNNAEMNATLVARDGTGTRVRYNISIRHRGASSRGDDPPNYRISVPSDNRLNGYSSFNLNERFPYSQIAGSVISLQAGLQTEFAFPVQVIENGTNRQPAGFPKFGHYLHIEDVGSDWAAAHFPLDPDGNAYRCVRPAELRFLGSNFNNYANSGYSKQSNVGENDWSDLVSLTYALNNTPDDQYLAAINQVVNIDEWIKYFAVLSMIGYGETSIGSNGDADDYTIYTGLLDRRTMLSPHDHDTDFGEGDANLPPTASLFRMVNNPTTPAITRFLTHPAITPLYWAELQRQVNGVFRPDEINRLFDLSLGSWVDGPRRDRMKAWSSNRWAYVVSQIITNLTIGGLPPVLSGYPRTTSSTVSLTGTANVIETRTVKVNGLFATWSSVTATWSLNGLPLQPGLNEIVVQSFDASGQEKARATAVIWYDDGTTTPVSGAIAGSQTWTAALGPYQVIAPITIGSGATLTVQPGTTIYLAAGASITVSGTGRLLAEGTEAAHIRFSRVPGAGNWGQIWLNGASAESRIAYAEIEYAGTGTAAVRADNSVLYLDHVTFANTPLPYLGLANSSFIVRNSVFPSLAAADLIHGDGLPAAGYGIIEGNWFGTTTGLNDIIDFSGGQRPGAILQVLNNVFTGAGDDILDLDGTDAHVEGNIFMGAHQTVAGGDTASAISAGMSGGVAAEITIARNLFYDCDSAALVKEGSFYTLENNTLLHLTFAALNFGEPQRGVAGGAGALLNGNIIWDTPRLFANYTSAVMNVTVNRSLLPTNWPGIGNVNADPLLAGTNNITWQNIAAAFQLRPGSPARGTGPNALDMGGVVPAGASISGEPLSPTPATTATLAIGGPGVTAYRYRVNGGSYSAEIPVGTPINLSGLANGSYTVFVLAKNSAGVFVDPANAAVSRSWIVRTSFPALRLSEVLARNDAAVPVGSPARFPDLIELVNAGPSTVSLAGWGVSDEADRPFKFAFPAGVSLGAGQYLILYADNETTPAGQHLGFSLKQEGDDVYLTAPSGLRVDSVVFGAQLADRSIARMPDGSWDLASPTFGAANVRARTGDWRGLKINEWLASGINPFPVDFIELFNPDPLPVGLGGLFLTDNPLGDPRRHPITPLSFIAGGGFAVFLADGDAGAGADHVNFSLASERGQIALLSPTLAWIDAVIYGMQTTDISMGRQPNGSANLAFFDLPSPGAPNPGIFIPNQTPVINEVLAFNVSLRTTNLINGVTNITTPDWVEIYNPSGSTLSLTDMSLTDDPQGNPRRFVFPAGVTLASLGYLRVLCDGDVPPSSNNVGVIRTGFGLKQNGGAIYLFDKLSAGGSQLSGVAYGVQAADFSIGRVPDGSSNWVLTLNTLGSANIAATLGSAANLKVNEWMANPSSGDDWFEIYNPNAQPVSLGGLFLSDDLTDVQTRSRHRIAALSFIGINSDAVGLYGYQRFEADGATTPGSGPEHVTFSLKAGGEQLGISTAAGVLIDGVTFGAQALGVSQGRLPDGTASFVGFPTSASPGDANYLPLTSVVINEALTHADPPFEDAIELRNLSGAPVDIGDWYLSDARNKLKKYRIPTGTVLAAGGFKVFYAYQFNVLDDPRAFELDSAKGDEIYLSESVGGVLTGYRESVKFGAAENAVSFGRYVTSALNNSEPHFVALVARSFGVDNPETVAEFRTGTGLPNAAPRVGPVVISEIMYHPPDLPGGVDDVLSEFIELRNITPAAVGLFHPVYPTNTWRLRDAVSFDFPPNTVIPANGLLLVVSFDPSDAAQLNVFRSKYGVAVNAAIVGPYAGKLDNGGESVELYKPDTPQGPSDPDAGLVPYVLVDKVKYSDGFPWPSCGPACGADGGGQSLQRLNAAEYGNDPINWTAAAPTPGPQGGGGDSDNDGMDDSWELAYFGTLTRNGQGDLDGDGMTDLSEFLAGTDPTQGASALRLAFVTLAPVVFRFEAAASRAYTVEYKDSLGAASWTLLQSVPAGSARLVQIGDPAPAPAGRFYRVRTP